MIRILILCLCLTASGAEYYASPSATGGDGSIGNPWPLLTALTNRAVDGNILYLRNGYYTGPFTSNLTNATVQSYPGEWAVVRDGLVGVLQTNLNDSSTNALNIGVGGGIPLSFNGVFLCGSETLYTVGRTGTNYNFIRGWGGSTVAAHTVGDRLIPKKPIIEHTGVGTTFRNFEITSVMSTNRVIGTNSYYGSGLDLASVGRGNKAVNLIVHNTGHPGIGFWNQGAGGEINGCLIWGTGFYDWNDTNYAGAPRGSAIYSQNETNGFASIKNGISFRNFTTGGKVYGETGPVLNFGFYSNFNFQNSVQVEASSGSTATSNIWFNGNVILGSPLLSYVSLSNQAEYVIHNTIVSGGLWVKEHNTSVFTNNTVFMIPGAGNSGSLIGYHSAYYYKSNLNNVWNYNTYYLGAGTSPYNFDFSALDVNSLNASGGGTLRYSDGTNGWPNWSGYDANSTYAADWPTDYLKVSVVQTVDNNRWHICVVNTTSATNATLNLSSYGFANGQHYSLIDAQNWPVVVNSGVYAGGAINLPLNLTNVSAIPGITHYTNKHTNVDQPGLFNAFVLNRAASYLASVTVSNLIIGP